MVNIVEELKTLYKNDTFPTVLQLSDKELELFFPALNLTITTDKIIDDSFSLDESLCSDTDLTFGACEASQFKITVADISVELKDQVMVVTQKVNGIYSMPLGTYVVDSAIKQEDKWFKDVTAYDFMRKFDVDVSAWYNGLTFPISVKNMRISLCNHFGVECEDQTLINDDVMLLKTINPTVLLGRSVLIRLCELNGGFGHFTRLNKFKIIQLTGLGLYPSETLYPSEDLFPAEAGELLAAGYKKIDYEEYIVEPITKLQIRQEDGDVGVVVGLDGNTYIITENFLLYGKTATELELIANNMLSQIKNKYYRPHVTSMIGLPYLEVGDSILIITTTDVIESFIFKRTLTGIQALEDEISATGNQKRENNVGLNTQIEQLKGRTMVLKKSVDGLSVELTDLEGDTIAALYVMQGEIELRVEASGVIAAINLTPEAATIKASKINFNGFATFDVNGNITTIDGSILETGTVIADTVRADWVYAGTLTAQQVNAVYIVADYVASDWVYAGIITADQIDGGTINGVNINSSGTAFFNEITLRGTQRSTWIAGPQIETQYVTTDFLTTTYINGYGNTPIHSGNISSQSVSYASSAGSVSNLHSSSIIPDDTGAGNINFQGSMNAASTTWVAANYAPIGASDFRLKKNIASLENIPDTLFMSIKTKQYEFKTDVYGKGINFGILAQELESAFQSFGLDPYAYNLIELADVRPYTDDGMYVSDKIHRINYDNLITWSVYMIQKLYNQINGGA